MDKLFLAAIKEETVGLDYFKHTGVGKINATYNSLKLISIHKPKIVINYGTAGTFNPKLIGKLHRIGTVKQRDMDTRPQAPLGVTPFEDKFQRDLQIFDGSKFTLSTGDNFVTSMPELKSDFVDMEGYAIAKVAGMFNKPCIMLKYASDLADDKATNEWQANQAKGKDMFLKWLDDLEKNIQELKDE